MARNVNIDICRLGVGHALILGNLPQAVQLSKLNEILVKESTADIASFGLFESSSPNYTTYYPDAKPEDFVPKSDEYINPVFRALSEVIVHKKYNPIDFGAKDGILRGSMKLLQGQTINADHETMIGNAMGAVAEVEWEDEYTQTGIKVPAGINSILRIDGKANTRIARQINSDPPGIHSCSVTVEFEWEQSHLKMDRSEFYSKIGTFDDKGELVRRVVTKIIRYHEISLVSHGADPYAQLKKDGKLNNAKYAHITYNSAEETKLGAETYFIDFKRLGEEGYGDIILNSATPPAIIDNENSNTKNFQEMKELLIKMAAVMGLSFTANDDGTMDQAQSDIILNAFNKLKADKEKAVQELSDKTAEYTTLKEQHDLLKASDTNSTKLQAFSDKVTTALRDKVTANFNLLNPTNPSAGMLEMIKNANYEGLQALDMQLSAQVEKDLPLECKECGSHSLSRGSVNREDIVENDDNPKAPVKKDENKTKKLSAEETRAALKKTTIQVPLGQETPKA